MRPLRVLLRAPCGIFPAPIAVFTRFHFPSRSARINAGGDQQKLKQGRPRRSRSSRCVSAASPSALRLPTHPVPNAYLQGFSPDPVLVPKEQRRSPELNVLGTEELSGRTAGLVPLRPGGGCLTVYRMSHFRVPAPGRLHRAFSLLSHDAIFSRMTQHDAN